VRFDQLELWFEICAQQRFSDDDGQDAEATRLFEAAAQVCAGTPATLPDAIGLFPRPPTFTDAGGNG
jgi:hypothetical protein